MDLLNARRRGLILVATVAALITGTALGAGAVTKTKHPADKPAGKSAGTAPAKPSLEAAATSALEQLCTEWAHKLEVRERDNIAHIKWETSGGNVHGSYTGYSQDHTCKVVKGTETDPVARISYQEITYKKQGNTLTEAELSTPQPIESSEVEELFHYTKGKWDY